MKPLVHYYSHQKQKEKTCVFKIAVVEDTEKWRETIKTFLDAYGKEKHVDFIVEFFHNGEAFLFKATEGFDLAFIDIDLPGINGLDTSRQLRKLNENICIIFFTEFAQFAIQGYEVNAFDYLVKPISYPLFCLKLERFLSHIDSLKDRTFLIKDGKTATRVRHDDVLYLESQKHYIFIHLADGNVLRTRSSLDDVKDDFLQRGFSRINRSIIVNLSKIDDYGNGVIRIKEETLPLSRVYRSDFMMSLNQYLGSGA